MNRPLQEDVDFLEHYGVKGMRWGVKGAEARATSATKKAKRAADKADKAVAKADKTLRTAEKRQVKLEKAIKNEVRNKHLRKLAAGTVLAGAAYATVIMGKSGSKPAKTVLDAMPIDAATVARISAISVKSKSK